MKGLRNMWHLFTGDVKRVTMNVAALIVVIGIVMLPALFTWFNVAASWDPFGNTKNLKVAVANSDEGYQSDLVPMRINIGETVVSSLRANDQMDWVFTDEDDAVEGTRSGKYYAAVVITEGFSKDMMTFFSDTMTHGQIVYYTNEKLNAIAPQLTGQGASAISATVNTIFTQTITEVGLNIVNQMATYLDSDDTRTLVVNLDNHISDLSGQASTAATTISAYGSLVDSAKTLMATSQSLVATAKQDADSAKGSVDEAVASVDSIASALDAAGQAVSTSVDSSVSAYSAVADDISDMMDQADKDAAGARDALAARASDIHEQAEAYRQISAQLSTLRDTVNAQSEQTGIPVDTSAIDAAIDSIDNTVAPTLDGLSQTLSDAAASIGSAGAYKDQAVSQARQASDAISTLSSTYVERMKSSLVTLDAAAESASNSLTNMGSALEDATSTLSVDSGSITEKLDALKAAIDEAADGMSTSAAKLGEIHSALSDALSSNDLSKLETVIGDNAQGLAESLAAPVAVDRHAVFPVENFGSALAPLYTTLAMWVGSLLMCVAMKCEPDEETLEGLDGIKPRQVYLGHFGVFACISLLQSTFMSVGELLFLGLQSVHPVLFVLCCQLSSLVFVFFIYTHVFSFGNVGKAVGVFFLVMQVAGAGGAYPLQMLPSLLSTISWFLPARYTINALRSAICGVYNNDFLWNMLGLLPFVVFALLLGLILRKPLTRFLEWYVGLTHKTKLM